MVRNKRGDRQPPQDGGELSKDPATRAAFYPGPAPEVWPPAQLSQVPWKLPDDVELGGRRLPSAPVPQAIANEGLELIEGELRDVESPTSRGASRLHER